MLGPLKQNYNASVDVSRISQDGTTDREVYTQLATGIGCLIVPLEESFGNDLEGSFGKDFEFYCETTDILEGDKIFDGTDTYKVTGVRAYSFMGNDLMDVRIRKFAA